ncbi:hypothetical protein [Streptomyces sp. NPDC101393]
MSARQLREASVGDIFVFYVRVPGFVSYVRVPDDAILHAPTVALMRA